MWQGGLAAGKPSVPWYQIHVRGIHGWRACRRPQARPQRFVQGNNGERSLGPAPGERRPPCTAACVGPPSIFNADHRPDASTRHASTRRPHAPFRVERCQCRGTLSPKIGLGPGRHALSCGRIRCLRNAISEARHRSVSAARKSRASFRSSATCSINRTLTLPEHEEGPKEAFEGPGFRRRAQSGVVSWTERTRRF